MNISKFVATMALTGSTDAVIDRCLTLALYAKDKSAMFIFNQSVDDVITCTVSTF